VARVREATWGKRSRSKSRDGEKSICPGKIAIVLIWFYMIGPRKNETRHG
jgi:hypothetical protein